MTHSSLPACARADPRLSNGGYVIFDDFKINQARAAILDFRLLHNVSSQVMTANRYDRMPIGPGAAVSDRTQWPFHTFDRIAFWQKTAERG